MVILKAEQACGLFHEVLAVTKGLTTVLDHHGGEHSDYVLGTV
jgi:hypothetical protein